MNMSQTPSEWTQRFGGITTKVTGLRPATLGSEFEQRPQLRVHRFVILLLLQYLGAAAPYE